MVTKFKVGDKYTYKFQFSQDDVVAFAEATGDKNPIHLDEGYAEKSLFKKRILHGFLGGSVFSKVFGTLYPGEGTIYLNQSMSFYKPMVVEEQYTAVFVILEIYSLKNRALVKTEILDQDAEVVTTGEALIKHANIT